MRKTILTLLILTLLPASLFGLDQRYYAGFSTGQWLNDQQALFGWAGTPLSDVDDDFYSLFGGVYLTQWLSVEAAYNDLGGLLCCDYQGPVLAGQALFYGADRESYSASLVAAYPAKVVRPFGKVGLQWWDFHNRHRIFLPNGERLEGDREPLFGLGAMIQATKTLDLRVEWSLGDLGEQEFRALSAGIQFSF